MTDYEGSVAPPGHEIREVYLVTTLRIILTIMYLVLMKAGSRVFHVDNMYGQTNMEKKLTREVL